MTSSTSTSSSPQKTTTSDILFKAPPPSSRSLFSPAPSPAPALATSSTSATHTAPIPALQDDLPPFPPHSSLSPALTRIDAALECPICKSSPQIAPTVLGCGHGFCSRCIRDSLSTFKRCPTCSEPAKESDLRRNRMVETIAEAWLEARTGLHGILVKQAKKKENLMRVKERDRQRQGQRQREGGKSFGKMNGVEQGPSKKRKLSDGFEIENTNGNCAANTHVKGQTGKQKHTAVVVLDGSSDVEIDEGSSIPRKNRPTAEKGKEGLGDDDVIEVIDGFEARANGDAMDLDGGDDGDYDGLDDDEVDSDDDDDDPSRLVPCPICNKKIAYSQINSHIDRNCIDPSSSFFSPASSSLPSQIKIKSKASQQKDWKKLFAGSGGSRTSSDEKDKDKEVMVRISKPNYNLSTPKDLRAQLDKYGIPTGGDKNTLVERVQLWISIYNSNLDRSEPKTLRALRAELERQEKGRAKDREDAEKAKEMYTAEGIRNNEKEDDLAFRRLTADIRRRAQEKRAAEAQAKEGATKTPTVATE